MTDRELLALYHERQARLKRATRYDEPLGSLPLEQRDEVEMHSALFRAADRAIARELQARGEPARLKGIILWLTSDQKNWVPLDPKTHRALFLNQQESDHCSLPNVLYRY